MDSEFSLMASPALIVGLAIVAILILSIVIFMLTRSRTEEPELPASDEPTLVDPEPPKEEPEAPAKESEIELDRPEPASSRMQRLRSRMARSGALGNTLLSILSRGDLSASDWEEIEETLLLADVGMGPTEELLKELRTEAKVRGTLSASEAKEVLRTKLLELVAVESSRELNLDGGIHPAAVLVVGVNGTGKTTTVGKIARLLKAEDKDVVLGAADTFRAAASEQLSTWGERIGVPVVSSDREGGDPASVAFDAVRTAVEANADVVIVDTAGRLQTKAALMDELGKIRRVMEKQVPVSEVLLVLDATTGQNGMRQAQVFSEVVGITGIALTKLDGSAKGGIVIAVQKELGVPVKLVGLGEGPDDLAPFDPEGFVDAIIG